MHMYLSSLYKDYNNNSHFKQDNHRQQDTVLQERGEGREEGGRGGEGEQERVREERREGGREGEVAREKGREGGRG